MAPPPPPPPLRLPAIPVARPLRRLIKTGRSALRLASLVLFILVLYVALFSGDGESESPWIIVKPQPGRTTVVEVTVADAKELERRQRDAEEARLRTMREARLQIEPSRIRAELEKAPTLVWKSTFEEWNKSNGEVAMALQWDVAPGSRTNTPYALPDVLVHDQVYFFNIKARGVFNAVLRSETAILPVYLRPNEEEASRVYLENAAEPVSWIRDADSDMGGYVANRWGGKLSSNRPANADPEQASGQRLWRPGVINKGKGPESLPYYQASESLPKDQGFSTPFPEMSTDEIKVWELAFFVPSSDSHEVYQLEIRNLEPVSSISEPWVCSLGISYHDEDIPKYVEKSDLLRDVREYCGSSRSRREYLGMGNRFPGRPNNTPYNASFVYRQTMTFVPPDNPPADPSLELTYAIDTIHYFVYGKPPSLRSPNSFYKMWPRTALGLGRWIKYPGPVNYTVGSLDILPRRKTCPLLFFKDNRSSICENQDRPDFRFLPFLAPARKNWIYPRWLTQQCAWNLQPLIMGDSLASSLANALSCHMMLGFGMVELFLGNVANTQLWPVKFFHPLFPDKGGKLPTFDEYLYYRNALSWDRKVRITLWQIGVWPTSYSDSKLWLRGLDLLGSFLARDKEEFNVTGYVATITPPQTLIVDGGWMKGPGYQTRGRAHKWNWLLRKVMNKWGVEVIDTWSPLEPRFDERTDNAHYCHGAMYELAASTLPRICPM